MPVQIAAYDLFHRIHILINLFQSAHCNLYIVFLGVHLSQNQHKYLRWSTVKASINGNSQPGFRHKFNSIQISEQMLELPGSWQSHLGFNAIVPVLFAAILQIFLILKRTSAITRNFDGFVDTRFEVWGKNRFKTSIWWLFRSPKTCHKFSEQNVPVMNSNKAGFENKTT